MIDLNIILFDLLFTKKYLQNILIFLEKKVYNLGHVGTIYKFY